MSVPPIDSASFGWIQPQVELWTMPSTASARPPSRERAADLVELRARPAQRARRG